MSWSRTQHSDAGKAQLAATRSRVKHSTTEPLCSLIHLFVCVDALGPSQNNFSHVRGI